MQGTMEPPFKGTKMMCYSYIHPPPPTPIGDDDSDGNEEESLGTPIYGAHSWNVDNTKELRIDDCNYEISELETRKWKDLYVEIKLDIEKVAAPGVLDGEQIGQSKTAMFYITHPTHRWF